ARGGLREVGCLLYEAIQCGSSRDWIGSIPINVALVPSRTHVLHADGAEVIAGNCARAILRGIGRVRRLGMELHRGIAIRRTVVRQMPEVVVEAPIFRHQAYDVINRLIKLRITRWSFTCRAQATTTTQESACDT